MEQTKPMEYREYAEYTESRPDGSRNPAPLRKSWKTGPKENRECSGKNQKKRKSRIRIVSRVSRVNRSPREGVST